MLLDCSVTKEHILGNIDVEAFHSFSCILFFPQTKKPNWPPAIFILNRLK